MTQMGLDMYLMKIKKADTEDVKKMSGMFTDDIVKIADNYTWFQATGEEDLIENILDYLTPVTLKDDFVNLNKMKVANDIPADAHLSGQSYGNGIASYTFSNFPGDFRKVVSLTEEQMKEFVEPQEDQYYVAKTEEIAYWRKRYDLQEKFFESIETPVKNCGYYPVPKNMLEELVELDELTEMEIETEEDEILVYHEWF